MARACGLLRGCLPRPSAPWQSAAHATAGAARPAGRPVRRTAVVAQQAKALAGADAQAQVRHRDLEWGPRVDLPRHAQALVKGVKHNI